MTPSVSVLVPAFRCDYLDLCVASILAQTFEDFELLISDDSDSGDIAAVVDRWGDPRIRYLRNPTPREPGTNRDHLISQARGRYLKFVFDDDFLLPHSIKWLHATIRHFNAAMAFHARQVIDDAGRVQESIFAVAAGSIGTLPGAAVFDELIFHRRNLIGEPTSLLLDKSALQMIDRPFGLDGRRMRFLTDMALYANLAARNLPIAAVGALGSCFRVHNHQTSAPTSPVYAAGLFEWELLVRWAADHHHLSAGKAVQAITEIHAGYMEHLAAQPILQAFVDLSAQPDASSNFLTEAFDTALRAGWAAVDGRTQVAR
ncbi:MAG: glycosyltransferase family 2 protein [Acidimicrobiales bacterium]|jgi:hypothetical protein|nr:glycosyltransferase family A protein [Actinomycetota bacterium]